MIYVYYIYIYIRIIIRVYIYIYIIYIEKREREREYCTSAGWPGDKTAPNLNASLALRCPPEPARKLSVFSRPGAID